MTTLPIKIATASDEQQTIDVIVLAFSADPICRWMYPDPRQYLINFPDFVRAYGGKAFEQGTAYYVDGFLGAALWVPPDVQPDEDALVALVQRTVSERDQEDVFSALEQADSFHPSEPHWYLPLIGVDPVQQGKGYGSALMKHALIPCDGENKLAYLDSTNPKNIPFYEQHGFELLATIQVGASPPFFPMLRKPR